MGDLFALMYNRLVHHRGPAAAQPPLSQMDQADIPGATSPQAWDSEQQGGKIYTDMPEGYSSTKHHITTVKADELTAILETLEHFTLRKNLPEILRLRYETYSTPYRKDIPTKNDQDLMYKTDFLLQDNVMHVFRAPIFTPEARFALFKLVHRMDSDSNSKKELEKFEQQRANKKLLTPDDQKALNALYPHLLNLLKVLMMYDNNYVNFQLSSSETPEPVVYKMWQGVQSKVKQIWDIICDAAGLGLLELDYTPCNLNQIAMKSARHRLFLQDKLAESEKALASLNARKREFDDAIREIQVKNIGLDEKIRIATGVLHLNAVKLHEHRDERRRALNNLKLIAFKTGNETAIRRWYTDANERRKIMEDMRNTFQAQEREEAAGKVNDYGDD